MGYFNTLIAGGLLFGLNHFIFWSPIHSYLRLQLNHPISLSVFTWQLTYYSYFQLVVGTALLFRLRVLKQLYGGKRFLFVSSLLYVITSLVVPAILLLLPKSLDIGRSIVTPAAFIFSLLAQYYYYIPRQRTFTVSSLLQGTPLFLSEKSINYFLAYLLVTNGSILLTSISSIVGWVSFLVLCKFITFYH